MEGGILRTILEFCRLANILTPPNVTVISTDGTPTDSKKNNEEGEAMLDMETVAGICLKGKIVVILHNLASRDGLQSLVQLLMIKKTIQV